MLLVRRKLVKDAIAIIGKMAVSDSTVKIIVVLTGVLVIATLIAAMQHSTAIVG